MVVEVEAEVVFVEVEGLTIRSWGFILGWGASRAVSGPRVKVLLQAPEYMLRGPESKRSDLDSPVRSGSGSH